MSNSQSNSNWYDDHERFTDKAKDQKQRARFQAAKRKILDVGSSFERCNAPADSRAVVILWDFRNPKPGALDGRTLMDKIQRGLREDPENRSCYLYGGVGYEHLNHFSYQQFCEIEDYFTTYSKTNSEMRMHLVHVPAADIRCNKCKQCGGVPFMRETDQADFLLIEHLMCYADETKQEWDYPSFLIFSSDSDFATAMTSLKNKRYNMYVAVKEPFKRVVRSSSTKA